MGFGRRQRPALDNQDRASRIRNLLAAGHMRFAGRSRRASSQVCVAVDRPHEGESEPLAPDSMSDVVARTRVHGCTSRFAAKHGQRSVATSRPSPPIRSNAPRRFASLFRCPASQVDRPQRQCRGVRREAAHPPVPDRRTCSGVRRVDRTFSQPARVPAFFPATPPNASPSATRDATETAGTASEPPQAGPKGEIQGWIE